MDKSSNAPDNVKPVDTRYSPRYYGGVIANRKAATLADDSGSSR